jgi:hypothetical protein
MPGSDPRGDSSKRGFSVIERGRLAVNTVHRSTAMLRGARNKSQEHLQFAKTVSRILPTPGTVTNEATELPTRLLCEVRDVAGADTLAHELALLGYPGHAHLPWVVLRYPTWSATFLCAKELPNSLEMKAFLCFSLDIRVKTI